MLMANIADNKNTGCFARLKEIFLFVHQAEEKIRIHSGLTLNEALFLCSLLHSRSPGELSRECGISLSRVSRILRSLESKGLILREERGADRRRASFSLSEEGERKRKSLETLSREWKEPFPRNDIEKG